ncbi:mechanosensitive ion channel domain-containing protein [Aeromonas schubertii]|uniref:Small-conductance mechanosensitive channel n=2 Tax=Aeromonas TaxID=642 RepID=A0A0S2SM22_9GAMM|nr:mechanosensitive ion channel domain-containing protein [Aeromonas schubertii]ALP42778.1 Small-conductance mechanosensitive channel [Aeromonas schubertii]KUE78236.1 mechanosensitive ion channel protein [Aeromonas schubertii]MBZ6066893.1 mechanosensitive ion channel [Aeromonas schubertii]MBZ6073708.1 mechanosensitive ion channel [Aeromonas schubertii]QCG46501.1 mechanosensitive ion channel [Aeromonas schubertii]
MEPEILNEAQTWLQNNQTLIIEYGVNIAAALLTLLLGYFAANIISGGVTRVMKARQLDITITEFVGSILKYAILIFVVIAALGRVGVQTASFVAIIGAAGLAIGLALQGSLSNFAAGFLLIIFRPIKAGEFIEVAGTSGVVQAVQLFTTTLNSADNKMVVVPNSAILNGTIVNYSRMETRRVDMTFGIGYGSDLRKAKQILERLVHEEPRILKDPAVTIAVAALADSSVNIVVRPWVKTADYWGVWFDFHERVKMAFDAEGIEIPFPQRVVHMKSE